MKKLVLVAVVVCLLSLVASVVISQTSVSTEEKDTYVEEMAKLKKVDNLLEDALKAYNDAVEIEYQKYLTAIASLESTHQPGIDALRAEKTSIENTLEGIK